MVGILLVVLLAAPVQRAPTLGAELLARGLPVPPDGADLEQPITSYSTLDDERGFAIAYYGVEADGMLHELRVRTYDAATRTWRRWTQAEPIGSVLGLQRGGGFLYVRGHSSPSASPLLVLTDRLEFKRELSGWPKLVLPDGRVLFVRSMIHFMPAHASALALYDPVTDRDVAVYPDAAAHNERGAESIPGTDLWMERSIEAVTRTKNGTIEVQVIEQRMRLDRQQRAVPAAPEDRATIVCSIDPTPSACHRKLQTGNR